MSCIKPILADAESTVFFLCDMHDHYVKGSFAEKEVLCATQKLLKVGKSLNIPLIVAETDLEKCGKTIDSLDTSQAVLMSKKKSFSMMIKEVTEKLSSMNNVKTVVLFGVETALDLLAKGYHVHIPQDTTTATNGGDIRPALERMRMCGTIITTTDTLAHELIKSCDHQKFEEVSNIVSEYMQKSKQNPLLQSLP